MTTYRKIIVFGKSILNMNKEEREIRKAIEEKGLEAFLKERNKKEAMQGAIAN